MQHFFGGAVRRLVAAAMLVIAAALGSSAWAQAPAPAVPPPHGAVAAKVPSGGTIREVRIEGTQRIEPETVRSYLLVQPGDPFDAEKLDQSLKSLFGTGLFADVNLRREGDTLIVHVVENPIVNRISYEGNKKFDDKALNDELRLKPRAVYTRAKVQADVKRILDLYRRSGRFATTVDPKVISLDQNRVDLVYEINEGPVTQISSINFVGNHNFGATRLKQVISTRESRWYRFFSSDDTYDPDRLSYDRELLRKFYLSQGYADFRVVSAVAELNPQRDGFYITFTLEEGARYHVGKVAIDNKLKDVSVGELQPLLLTMPGEWYNADTVEKSVNKLTDALGTRGYAFVDVTPQIVRHSGTRSLDITYQIKEGPRVYVERVDIVGNERTLDSVVRREFQLVEGDAFNTAKLRRSEQRIKNLNFFKKVDVTNAPGSAPDQTVITVKVEEQSTGDISLGGGFSTADGPLGQVTLHERNLLGTGQDLQVSALLSGLGQEVDLNYTYPYFLDKNMAAGFDLFEMDQLNYLYADWLQFTVGADVRTGYQLSEYLRQTLTYTVRQDSIQSISVGAPLFILDQAGSRWTSMVGQVLLYDRRDNVADPTGGFFVSFGTDFAGLGGQVDYTREKLSGGYFYSVVPDWIVSLTGQGGTIVGFNQQVRIEDRWFISGDDMHGFQDAGIGPRDIVTQQAIGGNNYYIGSLMLSYPLGLPPELAIRGHVFSDVGSLWGFDTTALETRSAAQDSSAPRLAIGTGISWISPFGPIRLDISVPILRQPFDKTEFFRVSFGTRF